MPNLFVGALAWFGGAFLGKIVYRGAFALGIGYLAFEGVETFLEPLKAAIDNQMGQVVGVGGWAAYAFQEMQIPAAIGIIFSAYAYGLSIKALTAATRAVTKD